jgi:1,4-dihydroxy-2-naphthoyl-CoA hydrolase
MIWWGEKLPEPDRLTAFGAGSMAGFLDIAFVEAGPDWLSARMPVDARTQQPFGRLHGGASLVLAETVGSVAGGMVVDPEKFVVVGMEINANHLRPAYEGLVHGTARAESLGRTVQVWTIRIEDEAGKLVCLSRFTAAVIARERG